MDIRNQGGRIVLGRNLSWSTAWLRTYLDLAAVGAIFAVGLTSGFGWSGPLMIFAIAAGWGTLRTIAMLGPARVEWSIGTGDALLYCHDHPEADHSRFRATEIDLEALVRSGGADTLGSRIRHPLCWLLTRLHLSGDARRTLQEQAANARSSSPPPDSLDPIEGNPSETVGESRILSACESDEALEIRAAPETIRDVVAEYFSGTHVLIAMCLLFGVEAALAEVLDALFVDVDAGFALGTAVVATVVLLSILFFAVVRRDGPDVSVGTSESGRPITLLVGPDKYEVRRPTFSAGMVGFRGPSWRLMERLRIVARSRVGPSAAIAAVLRPLSSIDSFLIAALTDGDREWLVRQIVAEDS